jgi:ribosomal protein S18 acetylase RimI-like enzyme
MHYRFLADPDYAQITACFNRAFSDYFVPFNATESYLRDRWHTGRVDFGLSVGAFDGEEMVGFLMTGVDQWQGLPTAFNAATGIVPNKRGQGIAGEMYAKLIPKLKSQAIQQSTLEVIAQNNRAIRAYEKQGFEIVRRLRCFKGSIPQDNGEHVSSFVEFHKMLQADWNAYAKLRDFTWSWEYNQQAVDRMGADAEIWEARDNGRLLAYYVYNPSVRKLVQWGSRPAHTPTLLRLLKKTLTSTEPILVPNVECSASRSLSLMRDLGMEQKIDLFEMVLALKSG